MALTLTDLIDVEKTQKLLDSFSGAVGVSSAIIDVKGKVLVTSPWQRLCTEFHRRDETLCKRCIDSDTRLANDLWEGKTFSLYRCLNGLTDAASPIIIEGEHLANAFIGQFFLEKPDVEFFRRQAREFGFDESAYMEALAETPIVARETLPSILSFLTSFAEMIASLGLRQLRQMEVESRLREVRARLEVQNQRLRASEQDLNRAQTVAHIGSWRLNVRDDVLHWSDETYRIFGVPRGKPLSYETFLSRVHGDDREMVDQAWRSALKSGNYDIEHRIISAESPKWVHERAELEFDENGSLLGGFGTVQDISENRKMIERIEGLSRFPDEDPNPVLRMSKEGGLLYANKRSSALLDSICRGPDSGIPMDWRKEALEALASGSTREIELQCGDVVYSLTFTVAVDSGYVNVYGKDITAHRAAEVRLLRAKEEWERTFDSVPDLIAILDTGHRIVRVNREMARRLGKTPDECIGLSCHDVVHSAHNPPEFCPHIQTLRDGREHVTDVFEEHLGGFFQVSTTPLRDETGLMIGSVHVARDITERKRMEDELRRSRDELETKVQERTRELQRSNQALQDFAFIASHDMQEPLRKVISFGDMLRERYSGALEEKGGDFLNRMLDAAMRMRSLLTGLLEYSRVATKPEPFQEVDLNKVVQEVLSDLEIRIHKTGGEVRVERLPTVKADPTQMRQLFQNLIGNALKFRKESETPVVVVRSASAGANRVQIVVEDNGIGFEEQDADRIFELFQRLHHRSSPYEGTGLGLAICKKIVERHGGSITARSAPGAGSCFTIDLPSNFSSAG